MDKNKLKKICVYIFWIMFCLGFLLFINRNFYRFLSSQYRIILLDHIVGGFLVTMLFYIFLLGLFLFFNPKSKIKYKIKWFVLASFVTVIGSFYLEIIIQNFRTPSQVVADYFGLALSWIYFLIWRGVQKS